jgi:hypothetical protein
VWFTFLPFSCLITMTYAAGSSEADGRVAALGSRCGATGGSWR